MSLVLLRGRSFSEQLRVEEGLSAGLQHDCDYQAGITLTNMEYDPRLTIFSGLFCLIGSLIVIISQIISLVHMW